jgi:hypothetical protein
VRGCSVPACRHLACVGTGDGGRAEDWRLAEPPRGEDGGRHSGTTTTGKDAACCIGLSGSRLVESPVGRRPSKRRRDAQAGPQGDDGSA